MKILFILHSHKCGGAEKHALLLMTELKSLGRDLFFAGPMDSWLAEQALKENICCIHTPMHGLPDLWSHAKIAWVIRKFKIDIIHGHLTRGAFYAGVASKLTSVPAVSTAHSTNTWKHFQLSKRIIAVSNAVRQSLINRGLESHKITTVYNGLPPPSRWIFDQANKKRIHLGLRQGDIALCMTARFIRDKGHDILIEATRQLVLDYPTIHVYLIGETNGPWYESIRNLVSRFGLSRCIHFLGYRDDVLELLSAMDLFIMPSRREAISLAVLEACSVGLPTIGASTGGIPEAVMHGKTGLLFPPEDSQALAQSIRDMITHREIRKKMGKSAKTLFENRFLASSMADRTVSIYTSLLDNTETKW